MRAATEHVVVVLLTVGLFGCCSLAILFGYRGDGHTQLSGEVVGPDGKPIAGAKVILSDYPKMPSGRSWVLTDEAGRYTIGKTHAPSNIPLLFIVTKDGYKEYRKEFMAHESESFPNKIVLETEPQAPVPAKN